MRDAPATGPAGCDDLLRRALGGDAGAVGTLFQSARGRLRQMVRLRLDRRLQGRLDPDDVLQEAYLDFARRLPEYAADPKLPLFLWLRLLAAQRLTDLHRRHFGAKLRDAGREVSLYGGSAPPVSNAGLADRLVGRLTSACHAASRAEARVRVREALDRLDEVDREVLTLRHFEQLGNDEAALVLGLSKTAASNRYVRALRRLKEGLAGLPGLGPVS